MIDLTIPADNPGMLWRILLVAMIALPSAALAGAADSSAVLVYGERHAFFVDAPHGWRQDCEALRDDAVCALFYRPGFTFESAPVVLYVNTADVDSAGIDSFIAADIERFRRDSPSLVVRSRPELETSERFPVKVVRLEHAGGAATSELVGYLAAPTVTVIFVASGRSPRQLDREAAAFADLVHSYRWMTDKVRVQH